MKDFDAERTGAIETAFKMLLSRKHLYQCVLVDTKFVDRFVRDQQIANSAPSIGGGAMRGNPSAEQIKQQYMNAVLQSWAPNDPTAPGGPPLGSRVVYFDLPTINTFCHECQEHYPFNPDYQGMSCPGHVQRESCEWFFFGYQCQNCKNGIVRFLVRREGLKLVLTGRDPIEIVPTPKVLPKAASKYFSDAVIAHNAGQTLAGLFLLRVFVEQFWRSVPEVKQLLAQDPRATGEKQGAAYQATLPTDFKSRFPSLLEVYGKLSAAIHTADANAELFQESYNKIEEHFKARELFKIFAPEPKA